MKIDHREVGAFALVLSLLLAQALFLIGSTLIAAKIIELYQ